MPFGKGRRKLLLGLGFLLMGDLTIWFSLPLWFPWVLRPLAAKIGAHYSRYERRGYARFSLHDLALTNQSVILHARRVDALVPSVWLWHLAARPNTGLNSFLAVDSWDCALSGGSETGTGNASSTYST